MSPRNEPSATLSDTLPPDSLPSGSVFKEDIFKGKVLFCTGGGSGICQKMVEAIMRHGASAFIFGRRENVLQKTSQDLCEKTLRKCSYAAGDVRQMESIERAIKQCIDQFGRIDFVIAGAAGTPLQAHVSAAKAGVDALSQAVAVELGPHGVRSNVIAPGPISDTEGFSRLSTSDSQKTILENVPLKRFGTKDDIANAAVFLFSPAASFITGTIIICDGGEHHTRAASAFEITRSSGREGPKQMGEETSKL